MQSGRAWLMIAVVGVLVGCQNHSVVYRPHAPIEGRADSLVFASPGVRQLSPQSDPWPWYTARAELMAPSALRSYSSQVLERQWVRTWDRQSSINGNVYTHFNQTTRRDRYSQSIR